MKTYQDIGISDTGKAIPHPRQPNPVRSNRIPWTPTRIPDGSCLYHKLPRNRRDGTKAYLRTDCCVLGHAVLQ